MLGAIGPMTMADGTWVFGYGSLVSPASLADTIGRTVVSGVDTHDAVVSGFARRWNYGSIHSVGDWTLDDGTHVDGGTIIALGIVESAPDSVNGTISLVTTDALAALDRRERNYARIDVTDRVASAVEVVGVIETYVPRPSSIERYERARDAGTAGVRRTYWDLVNAAFAELGPDHVNRYRNSTLAPDVPIVDIVNIRQW
jgi:cation transport regulator ChaC